MDRLAWEAIGGVTVGSGLTEQVTEGRQGPTQGVPCLQHEALDDPMKDDTIVVAVA